MSLFVLSWFHNIMGPIVLLSSEEPPEDYENMLNQILTLLDIHDNGFYLHIADLASANYIFTVPNEHARGRNEYLQISFIGKSKFSQEIKDILETFIGMFQSIDHVAWGFHKDMKYFDPKIHQEIRDLFYQFWEITKPSIQALQDVQIRYQALIESARDAIMVFDYESAVLIDANTQTERILGKPKDVILGHHPEDFKFTQDYKILRRKVLDHIREGQKPFEVELIHSSGARIPVEVNASRVKMDEKELIFAVFRDVTDRRKAQEELATRLRYETGLAQCSRALLDNDEKSILKSLSHLQEASGVSRVYLFQNIIDEKNRDSFVKLAEFYAPGLEPIKEHDIEIWPYERGYERWKLELAQGRAIQGPLGQFPESEAKYLARRGTKSLLVIPLSVFSSWYGFIGFEDVEKVRKWNLNDIKLLETASELISAFIERREIDIVLKRSEETSQALLNATREIVLLLDLEGEILNGNTAASKFFGKPTESLVGSSYYDLFPIQQAQEHKELLNLLQSTKKPLHLEGMLNHTRYGYSFYPVLDPGGNVSQIAFFGRRH